LHHQFIITVQILKIMFNLLQMTGPIVAAAHYRVAKCILDDMDQTSQAKSNEGATNGGDTDETSANPYALATYDDDQQPVPLASVPPSSPAGGVAFVPLPASLQASGAAAYRATVVPPPVLSNPHEMAFQQLQQQHHHRQEEQLQAFWAG
jgi:hypothetical protein